MFLKWDDWGDFVIVPLCIWIGVTVSCVHVRVGGDFRVAVCRRFACQSRMKTDALRLPNSVLLELSFSGILDL